MKWTKRINYFILSVLFLFTTTFTNVAVAAPTQKTSEGIGNYFITGESYPSNIRFAGYNSKDKKVYLNLELTTGKVVTPAQTATFEYVIEIFDETSTTLNGNAVTDEEPVSETIAADLGATSVKVKDKELALNSDLTAEFRIVGTVKQVTVTP